MIYANIELVIKKGEVTADNTICLYRGDKNVEVRFILKDNHFVIQQNIFAQLIIRRPNANSIFSNISQIQDDTVVFSITEDMINELEEMGYYDIQIRLFDDNLNARITLPPVFEVIEIRSPLVDDGVVGTATVGYATAMDSNEEEDTFLQDGSYNVTNWADGDIISAKKLNKVENALSVINEKINDIDVSEQLSDYAKLTDLNGFFDDVALNETETTDSQIAIDFYSNGEVVKTINFPCGSGNTGGDDGGDDEEDDEEDITAMWVYKDTDVSKLSTDETITKAYIELTSSNYKSRIDETLQWYPNCTDLYLFDDDSVTSLSNMTNGNNTNYRSQIINVTFLDGYFNKLVSMYTTFHSCALLTQVSTIPQGVTNMSATFQDCKSLTQSPVIPQGVTNMSYTFKGCTSLTTAPTIPNSVTNMSYAFQGCDSLTTVPAVIPNSVTNLSYVFRDCKALITIDTANWDTSNINNLAGVFYGCRYLVEINGIEYWDTGKVTNVADLFYGCRDLVNINLSSWDMSKVSSTGNMYRYCTLLNTAYLPIQNGTPTNALAGSNSKLDIIWVGERSTDFDIGVYGHSSFREEDIQELVPEHLADLTSQGATATLTLSSTYLAYLTEEEIAQAVAKGWTLQ